MRALQHCMCDPMAAIHLGHCLSAPNQPQLQAKLAAIPACVLKQPRCLITGMPRRQVTVASPASKILHKSSSLLNVAQPPCFAHTHCSGKTSLLFHYCYKLAESGQRVMFVCKRAKLELTPPLLPEGVQRSDAAWSLIDIKYINDIQDLKKLGACLHLLPDPPAAIAIDDLAELAQASRIDDKRNRDAEMTQALAYLVNATEHIMHQQDLDCQLIVSNTATEEGARSLYLLQRWFPLVLNITGSPLSALTLQVAPGSEQHVSAALARVRIHYSLTQSYVHLQDVIL